MIITVEGRPLNGPLKNSNTLKDSSNDTSNDTSKNSNTLDEPLMKGGMFAKIAGGLATSPLAVMAGAPLSGTASGIQSRAEGKQAYQEKQEAEMAQRKPSQAVRQGANILTRASAGEPLTEADGLILKSMTLEEAAEAAEEMIRRAERHTRRINKIHSYLVSMLFYYLFYLTGPYIRESIGLFFYWIIKIFLNFFSLLILFIIFNICLIIIMVIQKSLNISHAVVGGIAKGMQTAIDKAGFRIFGKDIKFLGFLQGPANKVKAADDKIPRTARQVIEAIVYSFFEPYLK